MSPDPYTGSDRLPSIDEAIEATEAELVPLLRDIATGVISDRKALQAAKLELGRAVPRAIIPTNVRLLALARNLLDQGRLAGAEDDVDVDAAVDAVDARDSKDAMDVRDANNAKIAKDDPEARSLVLARLERVLRSKPMRTLAGVAPVAIMTPPAGCPHGTCIYCPGGVSARAGPAAVKGPWSETGTPQSYTGHEPATRRGARHNYDPVAQVRSRVEQYRANGHPCDKVDLIVMGGTFTCRPEGEQLAFVTGAFQGLNGDHGRGSERDGPAGLRKVGATAGGGQFDRGKLRARLRLAHKANETADHRVIGMTLETRPDQCSPDQVRRMVLMGATRVELGVQVLDDRVLASIGRDHTVEDIARATASLKRAGLKVGYHILPGLPGMDPEGDLEAFGRLWEDPRFRPDMLKLYPTLVVSGTGLERLWRAGEYTPYDNATATRVVAMMKATIPPYVRVQRIQRDIPAHKILAGVTAGNLRQMARRALSAKGVICRCIRCSEAGLRELSDDGRGELSHDPIGDAGELAEPSLASFHRLGYASAGGQEEFMTFRRPDQTLLAYCRLRLEPTVAMVRELRVVGQAVPLPLEDRLTCGDSSSGDELQHRGLGRRLMELAERVAREAGLERMRVTSGVGVRSYYQGLGYRLAGGYMVKHLTDPG